MFYVGIDIAKQSHVAAILSSDGEVLTEPFPFTNDSKGFNHLALKLSPYEMSSTLIGLESTSHYGDNLVHFLFRKGYNRILVRIESAPSVCAYSILLCPVDLSTAQAR